MTLQHTHSQIETLRAAIRSRIALKEGEQYGADKPSPINRPERTTDSGGAGRSYPNATLKPVPVNSARLRAELNGIITAEKPKLTRWLQSTWKANGNAISDREIQEAIVSGDILPSWVDAWQQNYARFINERLAPRWEAAMMKGGRRLINGIGGLGIEHEFMLLGPTVENWIAQRGGELIVGLTENQATAMRNLLRRNLIQSPISNRNLAQLVRPLIGLTNQESAAVSRLYTNLLEDGVSTEQSLRQAVRRTSFYRNRRADRIARTEMAYAYNNGAYHAVQDLVSSDVLEQGEYFVKEWSANLGERTCYWCQELDGKIVGIDETYPAITRTIPNTFVPPAHPNCRCVIIYVLASEARE